MTSSLGNGTYTVAPGFEGARITPEQAEALAAAFLPSWESDGGHPISTGSNGHAGGDLRPTTKSNGVHAETHAPPSRTHVSEPEDSVVIDRSITADQIAAPPPDSARVAVAPIRLAPVVAPAVGPAPQVSVPAPPPALAQSPRAVSAQPPPRVAPPLQRRPSTDDDLPTPKSKRGLFIGLGAAAAAVLAVGIGIAVNSGDSSKADSSGGPTITVVKPDETAKAPSTPPPPPQAATATPTTATPQMTAATTPPTPVTALPVAASPDPPKPKSNRTGASQPTYNAAPPPRATQPRSGGGSAIVKDVPF